MSVTNQMRADAKAMGLAVDSNGSRYRFFKWESDGTTTGGASFFKGNGVHTADSRKEAIAFMAGYNIGRERGIREALAEVVRHAEHSHEERREAVEHLITRGPWL